MRRLRAAAQKKGNAQNTQREEEKQNAANRTNGGKNRRAALLAKTEGAPDNGHVLVMTDSEETLGYVVVALEDDTLVFSRPLPVSGQTDFTKAKPDPMTTFVLDTLMRSAASFGETNGMNHIRTAFPDFFDFFKQRGFAVAEDHAEAPMSLIVHYE